MKPQANMGNREYAQLILAPEFNELNKKISTLKNILGCVLVDFVNKSEKMGIVFMSHITDIDENSKEEIEQLLEECEKYYRHEIRTT